MSDSRNIPLFFNRYVESMPEDFLRATFERVLCTDWEGTREKVRQWRIRPGVLTLQDLSMTNRARILLVFNLVNHAPPLPSWRTKLGPAPFEFNQASTCKAILSVCSEA